MPKSERMVTPVLADAIAATFDRRRTAIPVDTPVAPTPAFAEDAAKQAQWQGFLRRTALAMAPGPFAEMRAKVTAINLPIGYSNTSPSALWQRAVLPIVLMIDSRVP